MIIASNDVETKYASMLSSIYSRMENNNKEITYLANLRDTLLPKLMSGEIDVNEVEI
jgi:type I restriction enzyme S subunit